MAMVPRLTLVNLFPALICASIAHHRGIPAIFGFLAGIVIGWPALPLVFIASAILSGGTAHGRRPARQWGRSTDTGSARDDREIEALRERVARAEARATEASERAEEERRKRRLEQERQEERERERSERDAAEQDLWHERWSSPSEGALPDAYSDLPRARFADADAEDDDDGGAPEAESRSATGSTSS